MAANMSKVVKPRVRVDATASKAIASRRGVRRVRHLHTQVLWVQEGVARGELTIVNVLGVQYNAEMGRNTWLRGYGTNARREQVAISLEDGREWRLGSHRVLESAVLRPRKRQVENID